MRLVDADELYVDARCGENEEPYISLYQINDAPTIDAVPVVRCKDCKFYTEDEKWCRRLGLCGAFNGNDFCSHGEKMTLD